MLPFVIGGGILIAIAFLLDDYSINPANFGMNTPLAAFFKTQSLPVTSHTALRTVRVWQSVS